MFISPKNNVTLILACFLFTNNISLSLASETSEAKYSHQPLIYQDKLTDESLAPEMIHIPSGSFLMGDNFDVGKSYEQPVHKVTFKEPFAISKYLVTFNDYDKFTRAMNKKPADQYKWPRGKHPVINVNWDDAKTYVNWLSMETGQKYRLPSEAEWEYTVRAGSTTQYPWGNEIGVNNAHCASCGKEPKKKQTAAAGRYPVNQWGIYNMIGNVWEMTADCWHYDYINAPNDGSA